MPLPTIAPNITALLLLAELPANSSILSLMSLEDAVSLVLYAFDEGLNGDIFVQKAPACTIGDLVLALKEIFNYKKDNIIIGTRHSEKFYETLEKYFDEKSKIRFEDNLPINLMKEINIEYT